MRRLEEKLEGGRGDEDGMSIRDDEEEEVQQKMDGKDEERQSEENGNEERYPVQASSFQQNQSFSAADGNMQQTTHESNNGALPATKPSQSNSKLDLQHLHKVNSRISLTLKWYNSQLQHISSLHQHQTNENNRIKSQNRVMLKDLEDERRIAVQNEDTYRKEGFRLIGEVQDSVLDERHNLEEQLKRKRRDADEQVNALAQRLLK